MRKGLVHLIAVVVVTGVMAAIAIPQYRSFTTNTRAARIISDTRVILNAAQVYHEQNGYFPENGYLPDGFNMNMHYEDWDVCYTFDNFRNTDGNGRENGDLARISGAWTAISIFSEDQKLLNAIIETAPGYVIPLEGIYGCKRAAVIIEPYLP